MSPSSRARDRTAKRATILDVAAAAGVSRQTVTRAMNDMPGIKQETRERVQELARELGYTPSRYAKGLVQGARTSVGSPSPTSPTLTSRPSPQALWRWPPAAAGMW